MLGFYSYLFILHIDIFFFFDALIQSTNDFLRLLLLLCDSECKGINK